MSRSALVATLLVASTGACGYRWQPPAAPPPSPGIHLEQTTSLRLPEGDEIGLAWTTTSSRAVAEFTFIDGHGYELTVQQLCERYTSVVGRDDVTAALRHNRNVSTAWWAGGLAALGGAGGVVAGAERNKPAGSDALVAVAIGVPLGALYILWQGLSNPRSVGKLTFRQAETLVRRYNEAIHHAPALPAEPEDAGAPD